MAISQGVRKLLCWCNFGGLSVPIERGEVELEGENKTGRWMAEFPMSYPGALEVAAGLGQTPNCTITVDLNGDAETIVTGAAFRVTVDFVATLIRIEGDDGSGALHNVKTSEKFINQTNANCVATFCQRVGLGFSSSVPSFMAGKKDANGDYVKLFDGVSYAAAIHKHAQHDGARWFVQNGTLNYVPQDSGTGNYSVNYQFPTPQTPMRSDALHLVVRYNVQAGMSQKVTINTWDPYRKQAAQGLGSRGGIGGPSQLELNYPHLTQEQAKQHAQSLADSQALNAIELTARVVGDPQVNAAMNVSLSGTGPFDGTYVIKKVLHELGIAGYTTLIRATKGAVD